MKLLRVNSKKSPYTKTVKKTVKPYTMIYLIRHANPKLARYEVARDVDMTLSEQGRKKRKFLTKRLYKLGIKKIYASGFLRAQETALELAKLTRIKITIDTRLNEIDWTNWLKIKYFNMSEKARRKSMPHFRTFDRQLKLAQAHVRVTLDNIVHANRGKKIAIFTHGNFIRAAVTGILDADIIGFLSLEIYQTSVTKIVVDKNNDAKINYINSINHLPERPNEDLFSSSTPYAY